MGSSQTVEVIQHLRTAVLRDGAGPGDGQLLEQFVSRRDEAALAALVHRHGPMVWGVCRRILLNHHDAEDAFQATFLVLVRKAESVEPRERVASWLYGVAYRTALRAKALSARRLAREKQMARPEALPGEPASDLLDLRYGASAKETLDLFLPAGALRGTFVFVHGGYWRALDKSDFSFIAPPFQPWRAWKCSCQTYGPTSSPRRSGTSSPPSFPVVVPATHWPGGGCQPPLADCGGGQCVDLARDPRNCGRCGNACPMGSACVNGQCVNNTCQPPLVVCGMKCADLSKDPGNCGKCGFACPIGAACVNGMCTNVTCQQPLVQCGNLCADLSRDPRRVNPHRLGELAPEMVPSRDDLYVDARRLDRSDHLDDLGSPARALGHDDVPLLRALARAGDERQRRFLRLMKSIGQERLRIRQCRHQQEQAHRGQDQWRQGVAELQGCVDRLVLQSGPTLVPKVEQAPTCSGEGNEQGEQPPGVPVGTKVVCLLQGWWNHHGEQQGEGNLEDEQKAEEPAAQRGE